MLFGQRAQTVGADRQTLAAWLRLVHGARLPAPVARVAARRWLAGGRPLAELFAAESGELAALDIPPRWTETLRHAPEPEPTLLDELLRAEVFALDCASPLYPDRLERAGAFVPPPLLLALGEPAVLRRTAVAIVGSRAASDDALAWAHALAGWLAVSRVNVVSGHARGIDRAAHAGAAERGGPTTAVIPEGILRFRGGRDLDLILSPFHPLAGLEPWMPLYRNGVIVALAWCVVVAESRPTGGTQNAARQALAMGRPVLVRPDTPASGNTALLAAGARALPREPVEASLAIMRQLEWTPPPEPPPAPGLPGVA